MNLASALDPGDRSRLFWRLQFFGWGMTMLLTIGIGWLVYSSAGSGILAGSFRSLFGFAATSLVLRPLLRHIRQSGRGVSPFRLLVLLLVCAALGWSSSLLISQLADFLDLNLEQPGVRPFLAASVLICTALYAFWCALYFIVHYWLDTQRDQLRMANAETAARSSELQMLRAQVNPHFLFNALNSILAESSNPSSVRRLTLALADYLRFSLHQREDTQPLQAELQALENYLRVEKIRFEQNLEFRIETDDLAPRTPAPVALVQPLVENAIKYGQRSPIRPVRIDISAVVRNDTLEVTVTNSGNWIDSNSSTKVGLANLQRRLDLLFDGRAALRIIKGDGEVQALVTLPINRSQTCP